MRLAVMPPSAPRCPGTTTLWPGLRSATEPGLRTVTVTAPGAMTLIFRPLRVVSVIVVPLTESMVPAAPRPPRPKPPGPQRPQGAAPEYGSNDPVLDDPSAAGLTTLVE